MQVDSARFATVADELERVDGARPGSGPATVKQQRMARSPFHFLRGSAPLYYADLASRRLAMPAALLRPPLTRVQGDCHFANFGFFTESGSHGARVVWAPNDFDDAAVGHAAFDLLRFCSSLFLVAEYGRGLAEGRYRSTALKADTLERQPTAADASRICKTFLRAYRTACAQICRDAETRGRAVDAFPRKHVLAAPLAKTRRRAAGGDRFMARSSVGKNTRYDGAQLRFRLRPRRFDRPELAEAARLRDAFGPYVDDAILDIVRRLGAGTGSVDLRRYYLLVGPDGALTQADLPLAHIVEVKQQRQAALIHHFPDLSPVNRLAPAQLAADCQRQMSRRPDLILDSLAWEDSHWLVRSRHHARLDLDPEALLGMSKPRRALKQYASACGTALARAHGRGDRRSTHFEQAMQRALKDAAGELVVLARAHAQDTLHDHRALVRAVTDAARARYQSGAFDRAEDPTTA